MVTIAALAACATTDAESTWQQPAPLPTGWIHDYDYESSLSQYLRSQYDQARSEGSTAYVYFYSDNDRHCEGTRRVMNRSEVTPALQGVRIVMLNFKRLEAIQDNDMDVDSDTRIWLPAIVKISADGGWTQAIFLPDKYVYHGGRTQRTTYRLSGQLQAKRAIELASALKAFFAANNEV